MDEFAAKMAEAEAIWAAGKRTFGTGVQNVSVHPGAEVNQSGLPIHCTSRTLPTETEKGAVVNRFGHQVQEHAPGVYSTLDGRPIVHDERARTFWKTRFNYIEDD